MVTYSEVKYCFGGHEEGPMRMTMGMTITMTMTITMRYVNSIPWLCLSLPTTNSKPWYIVHNIRQSYLIILFMLIFCSNLGTSIF